jgi:imidazolonepropionase-like amidohydrolase
MSFAKVLAFATVGVLSVLAPAVADTTVLENVSVIDGTGAPLKRNQAIVMTDGRIGWIGPASAAHIPTGAKVVDLHGKYAMPGIFDDHVHVGNMHDQDQNSAYFTKENVETALRAYAAYGVTSVFSAGTEKDLIFPLRAMQRGGRPDMARVFTAGEGIYYKGGYGGIPGFNRPVSNADEARKLVDEDVAKGVDAVKFWIDDEEGTFPVKMPYDISKAIIEEAHKLHKKVVAHVYHYQDARTLIDQGVDGFMHAVRDKPLDKGFLADMRAHGTWQVAATLSREASYAYRPLPFLNDPFFAKGVSAAELKLLKNRKFNAKLRSSPLFKYYPGNLDMALANMGREAKTGIPFGMGTDSGPFGRFPGFSAHLEMEYMVKAGNTPMNVIVAATSAPARFFGATDQGTLEAGKLADILVLGRNPLDDIRNTRAIAHVYISGREVPNINQQAKP